MKDFKPKGHLAMLGANITWGMMAPIAKITMASGVISPLLMTNFRIVGAMILFWIASMFTPKEYVPLGDRLRLAGAGMLGIVCNQGSYIFGIGFTSPGEASIITTTMPLWVMLLAAVILKEPITWKKAGGIALGASGALLLVLGSSASAMKGDNPMLGDMLVLTAQLSYALYLTFYKNFIKKYSVFTLMKWMFTYAAIVAIIVSGREWFSTAWGLMSAKEIAGVAYVVVVATFLAYILTMIGQKNLRPTLVGMYNYVQPIIASIIGVSLGLDRFTPAKVFAVALIFSGVYLVTISKAAKQPAVAAERKDLESAK